ncbi:MAG: M13 family metallopeptidase, partial [Verrucomicrobia bacterium]|nr:M13 family metallopeptidase [Verrucomicrobiota bacterium]
MINRSPMVNFTLGLGLMFPLAIASVSRAETTPKVPRFSIEFMDKSVEPSVDFYRYAVGTWQKNNPVPADKARWSGFDELTERNQHLIRAILEEAAASSAAPRTPQRLVGSFFASAMNTNRIEQLAFKPIEPDLRRVAAVKSVEELMVLLADLQLSDVSAMFGQSVYADLKNSTVYACYLSQGGLGLPDREYYLADGFAKQREAYVKHVSKMLHMLGDTEATAGAGAKTILELETALAKASKSRTDLRDPNKNYNKLSTAAFVSKHPALSLQKYLSAIGLGELPEVIVRQPEFFDALEALVKQRPLEDWKTYLRWHLVRDAAPFLHSAAERESFAFYGTELSGQPEQEPRWRRASSVINGALGEALGELYVRKHYPPEAKARMSELIDNLKVVFRERLQKLDWMTDATRVKALAKFDRFTQKIGHPQQFRDYSSVEVRDDDYLGNAQRAAVFEARRQIARIGKPVDKTEWGMTPQTVNAYANPTQNEIVFPAAILQPPFFDTAMDDAVNYGAIGFVIGHEITHHFDDQGRKFDAEGNLNEWWTEEDAKAFEIRAQKLVDQYGGYEALPGVKVNGRLSLGENIGDLGGVSIAYEALQRALDKTPSKRKPIDGFTPEQRFFLSASQIWRINWREPALRRQITVGPHS